MKKIAFCIAAGFVSIFPSISVAETLLHDDFMGSIVNPISWHIPTWVSPTDGTFVGRTQFRVSQNSPLPLIADGMAIIQVDTYNPTGFSFYGTDLISDLSFLPEKGIHITVRAKMDATMPGIVGGIFLYALKAGSTTLHDEIDFELMTNLPNGAQTNIYDNEPLGVGHPQFVSYDNGSINDFHVYEIKWQPNAVSWLIDGKIVRTETSRIPDGPMNFHLNIWVPGPEWPEAYNPNFQPTNSENSNQNFWMGVDSVDIQTIPPLPKANNLAPILNLLFFND